MQYVFTVRTSQVPGTVCLPRRGHRRADASPPDSHANGPDSHCSTGTRWKAGFDGIRGGDTDGIFQLESEPVRSLLSQIGSSRIRDLGTVTALEQIGITFPKSFPNT